MNIIDEKLIDYFIKKLQDGWLSKNEDEPHFICKIREIEKEVKEQAVVIDFLKKELQKKTSYRQVMKRQYRELKQKYDSLWAR
jgi:ribosomal protein S3